MRTLFLRITRPVFSLMLAVTCALASTQVTWAKETPIPVENFFKAPQFRDAQLSRNAEMVAMLATDNDNRSMLVVMSSKGGALPTVIARYNNLDVIFFHWVKVGKKDELGLGWVMGC